MINSLMMALYSTLLYVTPVPEVKAVPIPLTPSIEVCRFALNQLASPKGVDPKEVIDQYIIRGKLTPVSAAQQRGICTVYFLGITDFIALTSPKT